MTEARRGLSFVRWSFSGPLSDEFACLSCHPEHTFNQECNRWQIIITVSAS
jgi:hypothetical protein